ncbi:TPM domain-containing protein [Pseudomonas nicosulfuronedens]
MTLPRWLLAALLLCWAAVLQAAPVVIPPLSARVTDLTQTLDASQRTQLESQLAGLEQRKGAQIAVLLIPTTGEDSIEDYAVRAFEQWKLGRKGVDDGVLLVVAKNDRALRIEVGYGLEGTITDVQAGRIIRDTIVPHFKTGDFAGGIQAGVDSLIALIEPPANPAAANPPAADTAADELPSTGPAENYSDAYSNHNASAAEEIPPARLVALLGLLVGVPLLGMLLPVSWLRQRSMGRYLLCSGLVGGIAAGVLLAAESNPVALQQQMIGAFSIPLVLYLFFLPPMWLTMGVLQLLMTIISSIGRGGRGGGGGGFRGGGGSSGGGGASGRW